MEYAGYVRRGAPTDWSKVTGGIAQRLSAVEEGREKEREKRGRKKEGGGERGRERESKVVVV